MKMAPNQKTARKQIGFKIQFYIGIDPTQSFFGEKKFPAIPTNANFPAADARELEEKEWVEKYEGKWVRNILREKHPNP